MSDEISYGGGHAASRRARAEAGADRRQEVPLEAHAEVPEQSQRRDPVAILTDQDVSRQQDLVPIRHGRMSASAFTFYRGAAAIQASDLSMTPSTDLRAQLCGDAHLSNFGLFNAPDRRLVFDVNDFDETTPGPFEWDLKRLAASVAIAGRDNGFPDDKRAKATRASVRGYRELIDTAAQQAPLDLHYYRIDIDPLVDALTGKAKKRAEKTRSKAERKTSMRALSKLTDIVDGRRRIVPDPPRVTRIDQLLEPDNAEHLRRFFDGYVATLPLHRRRVLERYSVVDLANKVVGVGSVGTRCAIVLLESGDGVPLFLQFKEATSSVLEPYVGASEFDQAGERVVQGQRLMQATGDILLGWSRFGDDSTDRVVDFYFRQMWDGKGSIELADMGPKSLRRYARACGQTLALAHARSGDAAMISGYLGDDKTIDHAIGDYAEAYADIAQRDYDAHQAAIADGRIQAVTDV